jgi:hypothetical protein
MSHIESFFRGLWVVDLRYFKTSIPEVDLDDGAFPAFLNIDISGDEFEIPYFLKDVMIEAKASNCDSIIYNLIHGFTEEGRRSVTKRTINTILKSFSKAGEGTRIVKVVTTKGLVYYGCRGLILDENYNPLFIATIKAKKEDGKFKFSNPSCKISYRVFENSDNIVEKTIIKQALPIYGEHPVDYAIDNSYYNSGNSPVKISIEYLDHLVIKPSQPTIKDVDNVNSVLNINYDTR